MPKLVRKKFNGITLWPFVIVSHPTLCTDAIFLNHEKIHLKQQVELLIIFFYLWYGLEFLIRWIYYQNRKLAYRNISFEREAYAKENDLAYLQKRTFWTFLKFI